MTETEPLSKEARQVTRAAVLISIGNVTSRVLGLVRVMLKSYLFGAGGAVSAFDVAAKVPTMLYDQFVGGMLSAALIPVFSNYARDEDSQKLRDVIESVYSILALLLGGAVLLLELGAPLVAWVLGEDLTEEYLALAALMIRIMAPAVFFLNVAGLLSAALQAMQRFHLPAFAGVVYNATMVVVMVLLGRGPLGSRTLAVALLSATAAQLAFLLFGLRGIRLRLRNPFPLHPALAQIGALYLPIGVGLLVDQAAGVLSFNLASRTGLSGIAWMTFAAMLIQFPLGMVVTAVSMAILPTLSRFATDADEAAFRRTLAQGLRLVLILVLPAAVILFVLAEPLVAVLLQRGQFLPTDTTETAHVLRYSVLGLIFAALDTPLIFAFYARKDTWTPALVGVVTVGLYVVMALLPTRFHEVRLWELVLANSLKLMAHALLMLYLFTRKVGSLRPYHVQRTTVLALAASAAMSLPMWGVLTVLEPVVPGGSLGYLIRIAAAAGAGGLVYLLLLNLVGVEEMSLIRRALRRQTGLEAGL